MAVEFLLSEKIVQPNPCANPVELAMTVLASLLLLIVSIPQTNAGISTEWNGKLPSEFVEVDQLEAEILLQLL